jgi:hypothetical protein
VGLHEGLPSWSRDVVHLKMQHVLAGNPSRESSRSRRVCVSEDWRGELSPREKANVFVRTQIEYKLLTRRGGP